MSWAKKRKLQRLSISEPLAEGKRTPKRLVCDREQEGYMVRSEGHCKTIRRYDVWWGCSSWWTATTVQDYRNAVAPAAHKEQGEETS